MWTLPALSLFPDSMMEHVPFFPYLKGLNSLLLVSVGIHSERETDYVYINQSIDRVNVGKL